MVNPLSRANGGRNSSRTGTQPSFCFGRKWRAGRKKSAAVVAVIGTALGPSRLLNNEAVPPCQRDFPFGWYRHAGTSRDHGPLHPQPRFGDQRHILRFRCESLQRQPEDEVAAKCNGVSGVDGGCERPGDFPYSLANIHGSLIAYHQRDIALFRF